MSDQEKSSGESYRDLKQSLDDILEQLQHEATDIDEAVVLHKKAQSILKKLENYLDSSSKKIKKD